jgi:hypothetical protein
MRQVLYAGILLATLGTSAAFGTERIQLAQAGQTVAPAPSGLLTLNQAT